mgnify:CR=1 FL=1
MNHITDNLISTSDNTTVPKISINDYSDYSNYIKLYTDKLLYNITSDSSIINRKYKSSTINYV